MKIIGFAGAVLRKVAMFGLNNILHLARERVTPYDKESEEPVLRRGICTGELVAGFCSLRNGHFREVMLITSEDDLEKFCRRYAVDRTAMKEITAG